VVRQIKYQKPSPMMEGPSERRNGLGEAVCTARLRLNGHGPRELAATDWATKRGTPGASIPDNARHAVSNVARKSHLNVGTPGL